MNSRLKFILCVVLAVSFLSGSMTASANDAPQGITVLVDGNPVAFDQPPMLINSRVMVPIRAVAEAMGWEVRANSPTVIEIVKAVRYTDGTRNYLFSVNSITINLDYEWINRSIMVGVGRFFETDADKNIKLTAKPAVITGRTLVGVRDLAECLYATVEWDGATQTVIITSGEVPYYDGQGLPNRNELFEQMRTYYNAGATLTRIGGQPPVPSPQATSTENQPADLSSASDNIPSAPKVGSRPANILLSGKTDVKSADSYHESYKRNISSGCNWYAYGRLYETSGIWIPNQYQFGTRGRLHELENSNIDSVRVERDISKIAAGSIAIFVGKTSKDTGHAVFVEYVERDKNGKPIHVYYTDSNHSYTGYYDPAKDAKIIKVTFEKFANSLYSTKNFNGYIIPN